MIVERAKKLRATIERMAETLNDADAVESMELFPAWNGESATYKTGHRVRYDGVLYKVIQDHTSQQDWNPKAAVSLFAKVLPGQDGTEIGEWVQPDSTNPYMKGDRVIYNGATWISDIDNNVWAPGVYGWTEG